jgi:hypothetical protein
MRRRRRQSSPTILEDSASYPRPFNASGTTLFVITLAPSRRFSLLVAGQACLQRRRRKRRPTRFPPLLAELGGLIAVIHQ